MTHLLKYIVETSEPYKLLEYLRNNGVFAKVFPDPESPEQIVVVSERIINLENFNVTKIRELSRGIIDEYYSD